MDGRKTVIDESGKHVKPETYTITLKPGDQVRQYTQSDGDNAVVKIIIDRKGE